MVGSLEGGSGPPLVPNREVSRAIHNVEVSWTDFPPWRCMLRWIGFDAANGRSILDMHAHPTGGARYPRRDVISHPRPTAVNRFREAVKTFFRERLQYHR